MPDVRMSDELHESFAGQGSKIHRGFRSAGDFFARFFAGINDAPDAAAFAIHPFGVGVGVLIAGVFVIPIRYPKRAVGPNLLANGPEPAVGGGDEVFFGNGLEAGAIGKEAVVIDGVLVDVSHENVAAIFFGKLIALINADAAVGRHVMLVVHYGGEQLVGVRIGG